MPRWAETTQEIRARNNNYDIVRRERISKIEGITGRPLIVYATAFLNENKSIIGGSEVAIIGADKVGFQEVIEQIGGNALDVLIHSPGGSPEAAESIIELLRSKFSSLRFIIPDQAKSAATMMCCASDTVLMDEKSELGPIDPQLLIVRSDKVQIWAPAQAIVDQFDKAKLSIAKNPEQLPAWLPILQTLGPSLLSVCENVDSLSRHLVEKWLTTYMLKDDPNKAGKAKEITNFLASSNIHWSHGRRIGVKELQALGMRIENLNDNQPLQKAVWDLYLAIKITFDDTTAIKIIENCHGGAYIRGVQVQHIQLPTNSPAQSQPQRSNPPQQTAKKRGKR